MHYELHHGEPRTRLGIWLKRRHMLHHFRAASRGFGISCPWWDAVFLTPQREPEKLSREGSEFEPRI